MRIGWYIRYENQRRISEGCEFKSQGNPDTTDVPLSIKCVLTIKCSVVSCLSSKLFLINRTAKWMCVTLYLPDSWTVLHQVNPSTLSSGGWTLIVWSVICPQWHGWVLISQRGEVEPVLTGLFFSQLRETVNSIKITHCWAFPMCL